MNLYIGNLSFETTESELRHAFSEFEPLNDLYLPTDRVTGQLRGFAFVTLSSRKAGDDAIERLDGAELRGRKLRVNEARERVETRS